MTILAALLLFPDVKDGQFWDYSLTSRYQNSDTDLTNEETLRIRVDKTDNKAIQLTFVQKLAATLVDGNRIPTDAKAAPSERKWSLLPEGRVAYSPPERNQVEGVFQRVLKAVRERDQDSGDWVSEFMDETESLRPAAVAVVRRTQNKVRMDEITYRMKDQAKISGFALWNSKLPFPELMRIAIPKTHMPGGTDVVSCDVELKYIPPKEKKLQTDRR